MPKSINPDWKPELVKFQFEALSAVNPTDADVAQISQICTELDRNDCLTAYKGQKIPGSNGNISFRRNSDGAFIITATQLSSKNDMNAQDFVLVERYVMPDSTSKFGKAYYRGIKPPSSESIMHWYFYNRYPDIGGIIHAHEATSLLYGTKQKSLWHGLDIVETIRNGEPGTVDLPLCAEQVMANTKQYVILKEHFAPWDPAHTGVLVLGKDLDEAFHRFMKVHKALLAAR